MSRTEIIDELRSMRATASVLRSTAENIIERATRLENVLRKEEVSTSSTQGAQFQKKMAEVLAKRGKRYIKK